jgi:Ankyrin repeats (3 copies)
MIGFSLAHGSGALLFLLIVLIVWTATVLVLTVWNMIGKKQVSKTRWVALGLILLLFALGGLPEGFWQRAFIGRMAGSPRAGDLLLYAAYRGDLSTVQGLVSRGVPVNATDRVDWKTALHGAAAKGDTKTIRYLASKGADVNAVDRSGDSPLESAISNHQEAAANLLVELGARRIQEYEAQAAKGDPRSSARTNRRLPEPLTPHSPND